MAEDLSELRKLTFVPSRIPRLDALEVFVPKGSEADPAIEEVTKRTGASRWFPVDGGHRVQILYEGGDYDQARFSLVRGGWDHEHCTRCGNTIPSMTRCWVTESERYIVLCEACHKLLEMSLEPGAA
jgi:hypothetical protein